MLIIDEEEHGGREGKGLAKAEEELAEAKALMQVSWIDLMIK